MPQRLIRPEILTSDKINSLSMGAELFYRRLMSVVDDFGRYDARTSLLRSSCYPVSFDKVKESDVKKWLAECVSSGIIVLYTVGDKPYMEIDNFGQRLRKKVSKYPQPDANDSTIITIDSKAQTNDSKCRLEEKRSRREEELELELHDHARVIYQTYPKKIGGSKAIEAIVKALGKITFADLLPIVEAFKISQQGTEEKFIPHPTTWFNQERWIDGISTFPSLSQRLLSDQWREVRMFNGSDFDKIKENGIKNGNLVIDVQTKEEADKLLASKFSQEEK